MNRVTHAHTRCLSGCKKNALPAESNVIHYELLLVSKITGLNSASAKIDARFFKHNDNDF